MEDIILIVHLKATRERGVMIKKSRQTNASMSKEQLNGDELLFSA